MKCSIDGGPRESLATLKLAVVAATLLASSAALSQSADPDSPRFSLKGFGTAGLTHATVKQADVRSNPLVKHGAGYTDSWSHKVDTRFGAQLDARLASEVSGLLQVTSEQRHDGSFRPQVEWASIKYQPTSALSIQAGRLVLSSFLVSDHRLVGYANHWVRPPMEVYNLVPITSIDGALVRYRTRFDETSNTTQVSLGKFKRRGPDGIIARSTNGWNVTNTTEYGALAFNLTYQGGRLELEYPELRPLFSSLRMAGPANTALADKYDPSSKKVDFLGIGASYDPGNWFVMGEWGQLNARSLLGKRSAWYISSGYRAGSLTPYLIYSQSRMVSATFEPGAPQALNRTLARFNLAQRTISAGTRWDMARNTAFKLQFDHVAPAKDSYGELGNVQPGLATGSSYNIFSVALDFLF